MTAPQAQQKRFQLARPLERRTGLILTFQGIIVQRIH